MNNSDSENDIKREILVNIGIQMHELSFVIEINYYEIMNNVLRELLVKVKNNYISDNYISDTDDDFFELSDDDMDAFDLNL
jgi:hypothetical protein